MKVKLLISYDGTDFAGWQKQKEGTPTIQGALELALAQLFEEDVALVGSGRTDAGVHARGQVAHFTVPEGKSPEDYNLTRSLNTLTPEAISVREAWLAPDEFHALRSSVDKTYKYFILNAPTPDALRRRYSHWVRRPLDLARLNQLTEPFLGRHDFKSFQTAGTEVKSTVRQVFEARWERKDQEFLELTIRGDGFLKQMVRNVVGTILHLHDGGTPHQVEEILRAQDRRKAFGTAPAHGLQLFAVRYPEPLDNKCRKL